MAISVEVPKGITLTYLAAEVGSSHWRNVTRGAALRDDAAIDAHSPAMSLDYSPLGDAIRQLEKALAYAHSDLALRDPGPREQLRNSVIQCFEFTSRI